MNRILIMALALLVAFGFALMSVGLIDPARWAGMGPALTGVPLIVLMLVGSFILGAPKRARR